MPVFYLDTAALLKRYRTEKGTEVVDALFSDRREDDVFVTSQLTTLEVESVAARSLKAGLLNQRAHGALLALFAQDLAQSVVIMPVSTSLVVEAAEAVRHNALRAGDAIHIASALRVRQAAPAEVVFVTSDKELLAAGAAEGFETLDPEASDAKKRLGSWRPT